MQDRDPYNWAGLTGLLAALALISQAPQTLQQEEYHRSHGGERNDQTLGQPQLSHNTQLSPAQKISHNTQPGHTTEVAQNYTETALLDSPSQPPATHGQPRIDDFLDIALGTEWSQPGSQQAPRIRRWHQKILRIHVQGNPTEQDWQVMRQVSAELSQLTGMVITLSEPATNHHSMVGMVEQSSNHQSDIEIQSDIDIHFRPGTDFAKILPTYQPGNQGFVWVWWGDKAIEHATILIESRETAQQGISAKERSHLIREELTQSLGLMQDSWSQPDSIFYQGWTTTTEYSPRDKAIIQWLYQPQVHHNMTENQVRQVLTQPNSVIGLTGSL